MDLSFGARLRLQRERQDVTLATIAEQTKIRVSLLEGLERDDVSQWPGGIFRRAYVRAYAHAIGLDAEAVVREFVERYPDPLDADIPAVLEAARGAGRPPTRLETLIGSAVGALPARRVPAPAKGAHADAPSPIQTDGGEVAAASAADADAAVSPGPVRLDEYVSAAAPAEPAGEDRAASLDNGPADAPSRVERDASAIADLCTRLARAVEPGELAPVLEDAARILHAVGLILWLWDPRAGALKPVLAHGYSSAVLARFPLVRRDADNAIAEAFRAVETRVVSGSAFGTGALAIPVTTPAGCAGVLALEVRDGAEEREAVRAFAAILAAQLSTLVGCPPLLQAVSA